MAEDCAFKGLFIQGDSDVAKAEWGLKRICPQCGTRYYDMKKSPPVCPNCGTAFDPENLLKSRRGRTPPKPAETAAKPEEVLEDLPAPEGAEGEEAEDAVIEDAEELGEDVVEEVVEVEEER